MKNPADGRYTLCSTMMSAMGTMLDSTKSATKKNNQRKIFTVIILVILAGLSWLTYRRNYVWQTEYSLWTDAASKSPEKARAHYNLAVSAADLGKWEQAKTELLRTVELEPSYAKAYQNLVFIYQREGSFMEAARMREVLDKLVLY